MVKAPLNQPPFPPREKTPEEVSEKFFRHADKIVQVWSEVQLGDDMNKHYPDNTDPFVIKGHAMLYTLFGTLGGDNVELPAFIVAPNPSPEDKEFCIQTEQDWYPDNSNLDGYVKADLGPRLRDGWADYLRKHYTPKPP